MDADTGWRAVDAGLLRWVYGLEVPSLVAQGITHLATRGGVVVVAALVMLAFGRGRTRRAGMALAAGLVAHVLVLDLAVKHLVARERPFTALGLTLRDKLVDAASYSFPSGHTAAAFLGAWIVGARYPRWRLPLLGLAVLVGLSRLSLGAHYPTDVLAGAVFGLVLGTVLVRAFGVAAPAGDDSWRDIDSAAEAGAGHVSPRPQRRVDVPADEDYDLSVDAAEKPA